MDGLAADLRLLAALMALTLLPGLMLVRAPWSAVPFLSLGFWSVTWGLIPALGSRLAFVQASLVFYGLLTALRLPRLQALGVPRGPILMLAGLAVGALAPWFARSLAPGPDAPLRGLTARLLVWRDGLPLTYEPLLGVHRFGPAVRLVDLWAADVALLAGGDPARAAHLAQLAVQGLALLACFVLACRLARPWPAVGRAPGATHDGSAVGAALASALLTAALSWAWCHDLLPATAVWPTPGLALESACVAIALAWLGRGRSRGAALAAGVLLAAALIGRPRLWLVLLLLTTALLATRMAWAETPSTRRVLLIRHAWALAALSVAVGPSWWHLHRTAGGQAATMAWSTDLLDLAPLGLAAALCAALARPTGSLFQRLSTRHAGLVCVVLACATLVAWVPAWVRAPGWPAPTAEQRRQWPDLAREQDPLSSLCIDPGDAGAWLPALAGQAVRPMPVPAEDYVALKPIVSRRPCHAAPSAYGLRAPKLPPDALPALVVMPFDAQRSK